MRNFARLCTVPPAIVVVAPQAVRRRAGPVRLKVVDLIAGDQTVGDQAVGDIIVGRHVPPAADLWRPHEQEVLWRQAAYYMERKFWLLLFGTVDEDRTITLWSNVAPERREFALLANPAFAPVSARYESEDLPKAVAELRRLLPESIDNLPLAELRAAHGRAESVVARDAVFDAFAARLAVEGGATQEDVEGLLAILGDAL